MGFNDEDKYWISQCKSNPDRLKVVIGKDSVVRVYDGALGKYGHKFECCEDGIIMQLFTALGCRVDFEEIS